MPLHALSAAPVASPKRGVLWCVYVYWIYKEKILHPLQNRLYFALCYTGSSFRVIWLLLLWEVELINVCPMEPNFFALVISSLDMLHTYIQLFQAWAFLILILFQIANISVWSHTSFSQSELTSWCHLCLFYPFQQLQILIIRRPAWYKKAICWGWNFFW